MKMDKLMKDFEAKKEKFYKELLAKEEEELRKVRKQNAKSDEGRP
jgi:hypothetical protein